VGGRGIEPLTPSMSRKVLPPGLTALPYEALDTAESVTVSATSRRQGQRDHQGRQSKRVAVASPRNQYSQLHSVSASFLGTERWPAAWARDCGSSSFKPMFLGGASAPAPRSSKPLYYRRSGARIESGGRERGWNRHRLIRRVTAVRRRDHHRLPERKWATIRWPELSRRESGVTRQR
jgi:hypothetical protein